jgi:hypothetical protein
VRVTSLVVTLAALGGLWAPIAAAQCEPEPEPPDHLRAVARQHYTSGVEAAAGERWMEAREAFQRAYDIAPFAPIVYNLATAQAHTGMLVEAAESYRRFLRRCQSEQTPELRADAQQLLGDVTPRIGRLTLRIRNLAEVDSVELDGDRLATAVLDTAVPINPGPHELRIVRVGEGEVESREFRVEEGERRTVELAVPEYVPSEGDDGGSQGGGSEGGGDDTPVIVGVTVGVLVALGAAAGIVAGVVLGNQGNGQEVVDGTWPEPVRLPLISW